MAETRVEIRALAGTSLAVGFSGPRTVTIDRTKEAGGMGLGFNGGELLLLAIGGCYSNDVFREAAKRGINVQSVRVMVSATSVRHRGEADKPECRLGGPVTIPFLAD